MAYRKLNYDEIKQMLLKGLRYSVIGKIVGCSKQRVYQLAQQWKINPEIIRQDEKEKLYHKKWGNKTNTDLYRAQRHKFLAKKQNLQRVGKQCTLEFGDIDWPTHCPVLGIEIDYFADGRQENSPSFDRLDSSKGYVPGNVNIMSWRANRIKNDGTIDEHKKIVEYLDKQKKVTGE